MNIYKKPPIYKQRGRRYLLSYGLWTGATWSRAWKGIHPPFGLSIPEHSTTSTPTPHSKHVIEGLIIESSKFPAAQRPDPSQPAKIETDYWPCPPSLAVVGKYVALVV